MPADQLLQQPSCGCLSSTGCSIFLWQLCGIAYDLLVADEPFTGLDPKQIAVLKQLLVNLKKSGKLVLLSSHLLDLVENICDTFVIIKQGRLLASGTKAELLRAADLSPDSSMENVYLKLVNGNGKNK